MQSGNLYVYCVGNPVMYRDPTGNAIAKSYDSGDNDLIIKIAAIIAISGGVIIHFAAKNTNQKTTGKISGGTAASGAPRPDPDDDSEDKYKVSISKSTARQIRKLAKEQFESVQKILDQLRSGDFRGLHNHPLSGKRTGQWAVDISGSGKGRGAMRLIYELRDGIITIVELINHHRY